MSKSRRNYSSEEKVAILKRHLLEKEPVSDICDKLNLAPTQFYRWQKEFFENGFRAFDNKSKANHSRTRQLEEKLEHLEDRLKHKDNIIAEITEDYVRLKKNSGAL
jgi:transposase